MDGFTTVEVWVLVNDQGEYDVGPCDVSCQERFDENCSTGGARRLVKVTLNVPTPKAVELVGTVPAESEGGELKVA
jgi:hypothetical protein